MVARAHLEAMLGLYWANKGFVGSFWGSTFNPNGSGVRLMLGHLEATMNVDPLFGPFKTILGMPLLGHVGLCWRLSGLRFNSQRKIFLLRVNFGSVSGLCWAIWKVCWAHVGPLLAHLGVCWGLSGLEFQSQPNMVRLGLKFGSVSGLCWAIWKVCWAYVGPMLGLCWLIWGSVGGFRGLNFNPNGSMVPLGLNFGSVSGLCWAIWRLCWVFVGI